MEFKLCNEQIDCDRNQNCIVFGPLTIFMKNVACGTNLDFICKVTQPPKSLKNIISNLFYIYEYQNKFY